MALEFIADSPNPKSPFKPFRERFWSLADVTDRLDIAVGYVDVASLVELTNYVEENSDIYLNLLVGMQYFEGFTVPQLSALNTLADRLRQDRLGEVLLSTRVHYHGKLYSFGANSSQESVYVGSGNLSSISQSYSSTYEAGVLVSEGARSIVDYMQSILFRLGTPLHQLDIVPTNRDLKSPLEKMDEVEKTQETTPYELVENLKPQYKFSIPIKETPRSNLNVFFGKGRESRGTGRTLARPWYEAELIPGTAITRSEGYPQNKAEFDVITDNGFKFSCNVNGQEGNKNLRSSGSLSILGAYLKGHLEANGLLKPGQMVTSEILEKYGRSTVDLMFFSESKRWVMDFRPGVAND
ncbi:type II restriction enzyme NgoFVII (EndonucleaseNgoFVII) (R.NgoFVII) (R.NgoVII) [Corynebacterium deserti GIMN1.010]|uniref:Type II restriction enzyme NgoFVII (EndonucleaseNgoFVII) (R.NgoFVII) (R.NgoVII) n=1 Tax=Corynebacterium deserti GIMN1.010 TaxID=931089 RepID=A0A0M4CLA7_9CORY|nr:restriction endonuclease PLD domain-containing protein [Corynebacterium deserti]ALC05560.1 type II restriction enzyme NgoFVII (EndonucleaseNgoFVII) (R.NgoFVII) (R.NgoVII) [Corynebacterium deserti GIMN1.010]